MGHDTHFLTRLERLASADAELALAMYRNTPLVRAILTEAAPPAADRVAIALSNDALPPHVLVARNGTFVTCLAAGMRHDLPVISRAAVDRVRRESVEVARLMDAARRLQADPDHVERGLRLQTGPRVSREDVHATMAWAPALSSVFAELLVDRSTRYMLAFERLRGAERLRRKHATDVARLWRFGWMLGHLAGPAAFALGRSYVRVEPDEPPHLRLWPAMITHYTRLPGTVMRGIWTEASIGDIAIGDVELAFRESDLGNHMYAAGASLVAIGLRWPELRARVAATLTRRPALLAEADAEDEAWLARLRDVLADPRSALERHLAWARERLEARLRRPVDLEPKLLLASSAYDPEPMADAAAVLRLADAAAFVAASEFEDLYLPADVLALVAPPDDEPQAEAYADRRRAQRPAAPAPSSPSPGRNAPCSCGSGLKYKKCHGAGQPG